MKHPIKLTIIILAMFLVTQFIGLYVVNHYSGIDLPYGMDNPEIQEEQYTSMFSSIIFAFIFAIAIMLLLTKIKARFVMRLWFLLVVILALGITFTSLLDPILPEFQYTSFLALILALPFALSKVYSQDILTHNFTELLIYPGIAAIFVPFLNIFFLIALLILISLYDMWAVWKSGIMQKMAKYQMEHLKVFGGFMVPYLTKAQRDKLKKLKKKKINKEVRMKVNTAILGGGDVVFTAISAGVALKILGVWPSIIVILGALLGLSLLMIFAKKKMYPAMPFISAGIFLALGISYLFF